jgi:unsaturated rhamnogalacturonyl hydrolase
MRNVLFFGIGVFLTMNCYACKPAKEKPSDKWSVKMVNNIIAKYDTLTNASKKWTYDMSYLARAINDVSDAEQNKDYYQYFKSYVDYFIDNEGNVKDYRPDEYNLDRIQPARNLLILYKKTGEEKYKKAILKHVEQMKTHPRTSDGGYWHKKVYPYQMWLDGLYMAEPFLVEYAKTFNDPVWFDEAFQQLTLAYKHTLDLKTGLLYHAWDESKSQRWCNPETGQSKHFWSRATGWYTMAIIDVLDNLPENYKGRDSLIHILQNVCTALENVQDTQSGLWYQVLDQGSRKGNYLEASGSSMFVYTFAKGVRKGYLDKHFKDLAIKGYDGIISKLIKTDENGKACLTQVCGGCGLGGNPYRDGSYEYYISEKVFTNDTKGVAPFIMASLELGR